MLATIGYERSKLEDFVATLQLLKIETLVDVREKAQSRRPGFSKRALSDAVMAADINYIHIPELGDPKAGREAARSGNHVLFRAIYEATLASPAAQIALAQVERLASTKAICLMCFERDPVDCHRKIITDTLEERLSLKAQHRGVVEGAANVGQQRRVLHTYQSAATPFQQVF